MTNFTPLEEKAARHMCAVAGIDPDAKGFGLGKSMPEGSEYPLWHVQALNFRAGLRAIHHDICDIASDKFTDGLASWHLDSGFSTVLDFVDGTGETPKREGA